jgi:hypothetical protein
MAAACAEDTPVLGNRGGDRVRQASAFDCVGGVLWWMPGNPVSASCPTYCVSASTGTKILFLTKFALCNVTFDTSCTPISKYIGFVARMSVQLAYGVISV